MQILAAIDLRGGLCVRLRQGDYDRETIFNNDPVAVAQRWEQLGADWLHLVDLDGARSGKPTNTAVIRKICASIRIPCQVGGGIRTDEDVNDALSSGAQRVVVGTRALQDPSWFHSLCEQQPAKIVLGLDARNGHVATHGWIQTSNQSAVEIARTIADLPLAAIAYTDIHRDGMLEGPNLKALDEMRTAIKLPIIASGGVTSIEDVRRLAERKLAGCIIGRALYEGRIDLATAVAAARNPR